MLGYLLYDTLLVPFLAVMLLIFTGSMIYQYAVEVHDWWVRRRV